MFRKEKMKGNGREKDNLFGEKTHLTSNNNHHYHNNYGHQHSISPCTYDEYNLSDVGSSSMIPQFDPSQFSTHKNNFVDQQYYVSPNVSDSSWYKGSMMDEFGLTSEFQKMNIGNRVANDVVPFDYGRFGCDSNGFSLGDRNVARIRPSNTENPGVLDGFANGFSSGSANGGERVSSPLYRDARNCRLLGERVSTFGDLVGSYSPYGGGAGDLNYFGNGLPIMRGNKLYDDRMSMDDCNDYVGNGGRMSSVNEHFGNGSLVQRGNGGYGDEFPVQFPSMYGPPVVDDSLQQYIMEGCKEMLNSWANSPNYDALLHHYGGQILGDVDDLNPNQAISRGNVLYNAMRQNMRVSEQRYGTPPLARLKNMRHSYTGEHGDVNLGNRLNGRNKTLYNGKTVQKIAERSFDLERSVGIGSPNGSCDSLVLQNLYKSLEEVQGEIYMMAKDQNGCRFLQKKFENGSFEDVQTIFNEIIHHVVELMIDPFGNYLIQKLLDVCNEEHRMKIVHVITKDRGELIKICLNTHGTRVVQKLIDSLKTRKQISLIIRALEPGFLDLIKDLNGNHVVQRCLQCLNYDDNKFIFDAASKFCVEIATHRHGCCVLQRCIAYSNGDHRKKLIEDICRNGLTLARDPFGNYVVQYIIELKIPSAAAQLISQFEGHYVQLAMQKFSSHVVEKCLKYIEGSQARIVYELLSVPRFEQLLQDPFANYVVQCALDVTQGALHEALVSAVEPHSTLRTNPYCKKIFTRGLIRK